MDERRARIRRLTLVFFVAAFLRLIYWSEIRSTVLDRWHLWNQSDMQTYIEQAQRIANGDWLGRDPYHPYHLWQHGLPEADWLAFYPPRSFHQAPAYSYLLAALHAFSPRDLPLMKLLQILFGGMTCVLLHELARALGGARAGPLAGWIAGFIAAVYGPMIQIELQILREGPMALLLSGILALIALHWKRCSRNGLDAREGWSVAAIGAALGALTLLHETGQVAFLAAVVSLAAGHAWLMQTRASRRVQYAVVMGCLFAGYVVGVSPLVVRNLTVGAPPMTLSSRSGVVFLMSNFAQATDGGSRWGEAEYIYPTIRAELNGEASGVLIPVLQSYAEHEGLIFRNVWLKFRAVSAVRESADNTSYAFYRERSAVLRWLPAFWILFAPAWGAVAALIWESIRRRGARELDTESRGQAALALTFVIFFLALLGALSLVHSLGRLRLCIVPVMIPLAGVFFAWLIERARAMRSTSLRIAVPAFAIAALWQGYAQWSVGGDRPRTTDYVVAANLNRAAGEFELAADDYRQAIEMGAEESSIYRALGEMLMALGRNEEAAEWFAKAEAK